VIAGLVVAAILAAAMSNLSAALNALASTSVVDFYKSHFAPGRQRYVGRIEQRDAPLEPISDVLSR